MTLESGLIPADARSVYIIYYHDGAVKTIQPTAFEASAGYLAFNANEFSVYSLVYKTGTAEETTPNTTSGTLDNVPKTGGSSALLTWTVLGLCSTAMLAGVAVYDKKRAR